MKQRIITGVLLGLVLIPAVIAGGYYFFCASLIITALATFEVMNMCYKKNEGLKIMRYIVPAFSCVIDTILFITLKKDKSYFYWNDSLGFSYAISNLEKCIGLYGLLLTAYLIFVIVIIITSIFLKNGAKSAIESILALTYCGLLLSLACNIEYLPGLEYVTMSSKSKTMKGILLIYLYSIVAFTDMFAYFTGMAFGKHKLCPTISPKKTIEGAIGGLVIGSVFGTLIAVLFKVVPVFKANSFGENFVIILCTFGFSILISFIVQIGDLFASLLKRHYEIKDFSNILPGHGGVMDRFDSFTLAGSFFFVFYMLLRVILIL